MFDFEKLEVYQIAKALVVDTLKYIYTNPSLDPYINEEWKKASMAILLNLSEGTGRMVNADKKHYITVARSSVFECVAILEVISQLGHIPRPVAQCFDERYEKVSKMLLGMVRSRGE
jgi:four helix bundle protein